MKPGQGESKSFFSRIIGVAGGTSILWFLLQWILGFSSLHKQTSGQLAISLVSFVVIYIAMNVANEVFEARRKN
jgi:hypothetical protein